MACEMRFSKTIIRNLLEPSIVKINSEMDIYFAFSTAKQLQIYSYI